MTSRRRFLQALTLLVPGASHAERPAWLAQGPRIPDSLLLDHRSRPVRLRPLLTAGPVAVNFIYTGCSSFCPPQTAIFRELQGLLASDASAAGTLVSISIDPVADTPRALSLYAERFAVSLGQQERWLMLTGSATQIDRVLSGFGIHASSLLDHPSQVWIGSAEKGRWMRVLGLATAPELLGCLREVAA